MSDEKKGKKPDTTYRKTYVLRQQTPMIHFQHRDNGVAIRASEFKPKLDKFLLKKLSNNLSGKENWILKQADEDQNRPPAFNYKVRIVANGKPIKSETIERDFKKAINKEKCKGDRDKLRTLNKDVDAQYAKKGINNMYFGNMVKADDDKYKYKEALEMSYKETIFYKADIYVEIQCFVKGLLSFIDANMAEFLLVTNFGTRQSKGFGCFSLEKNRNPIGILKENQYDFIYCEIGETNRPLETVTLEVAAAIYAVMKGGINRSKQRDNTYDENKYVKGYIQRQYLNDIEKEDVKSDKAFMKEMLLSTRQRKNEKYEYVRAILGIPESIEFRATDQRKRVTVSIKDNRKDDKKLERFQSAIQIVVSGRYVILIMNDSYKAILGKEFIFSSGRNEQCIKVPSEFNPDQFLSGFVKYFNKEKRKLKYLYYKDAAQVELKMGREGKQ